MSFIDDVFRDAKGRWPGIFEQLGIDVGTGKHCPCPAIGCGGKDRFRYDNRHGNGDYICGQCGAGNGITLISKCKKTDYMTAAHMVAGMVGTKPNGPPAPPRDDTKKRENLNKLWAASTPLTGSDPVSKYLHSRGISLTPKYVRYCAECFDGETKKEYPAMISKIMLHDKPVGLHRTFLEGDMKARKKKMPAVESTSGGAVQLFQPGGMYDPDTLGVAEGIETACSATQIHLIATWAASPLKTFDPPIKYRQIMIYSDNDAGFMGQESAFILARKLYQKDFIVEVCFPEEVGDFNDVLKKELEK